MTIVENAASIETLNHISQNEFSSCVFKNQFVVNSDDDKKEMAYSRSINNDDKETNEDPEFISITSEDKHLEIDSDSQDEAKDTNVKPKVSIHI